MKVTRYFEAIRGRAVHSLKIKYFQDTDTLYIELRAAEVTETRDLDDATVIDLDAEGHICAITLEHARERGEFSSFSFEQIPV